MLQIRFNPPGPVAAEFLKDRSYVSGIMGPVGSGKSSVAAMKLMMMALEQPVTGTVKDSRWLVTRNTYGELKSTTIKTWLDWFPEGPGGINTMRWDAPITSVISFPLGEGVTFRMEVIFIALDKPDDLGKLRSIEATGAWMNEGVLQPKEVLDMLTQRIARYPSKKNGGPGPVNPCVIVDTNPPDDDHWYYRLAEVETPKGWRFFRQPGGLMITGHDENDKPILAINKDAENVMNLFGGWDYYLNQSAGKDENWIKVFLCAEYGTTMAGKPVFPEFRDVYHVSKKELAPIPGVPLRLGWDFGLTPVCIIGQMTPTGQLRILEELISTDARAEGMGIRQFGREVVKPHLLNKYPNFRFESFGDPAGNQRAQTDEKTCLQELMSVGIATESAPTNSFIARREAVAYFLNANANGEPGFLLDPRCVTLRRGFNGGYRYERMRISGIEARYRDTPTKDKYSHPHDGLQYLALSVRENLNPIRARAVEPVSPGGWT
jgi:hypothetical protein